MLSVQQERLKKVSQLRDALWIIKRFSPEGMNHSFMKPDFLMEWKLCEVVVKLFSETLP